LPTGENPRRAGGVEEALTPLSCRMARAGLHWKQSKLAAEADVSVEIVRAFASHGMRPHINHIAAMLNAFEDAGVGVLPDLGGGLHPAAGRGRLDATGAFAASQLNECFQIEAWGEDKEEKERRTALAADIAAAAEFISCCAARPRGPVRRGRKVGCAD
jgi:hypothetical protein